MLLDKLSAGEEAYADGSIISSALLRHHLLGICESRSRDGTLRKFNSRWVIRKAIFADKWDFSGARRASGGSLPALEFDECEFKNGFDAKGASLDRLEFRRCKFTSGESGNYINLRNCTIQTELYLEVKPGHTNLLRLDAAAITVGTNVVIQRTTLRVPPTEDVNKPDTRYALDLGMAKIGRNLDLTPGLIVEGGINLTDAQIGGSVSANDLEATDGENDDTLPKLMDRNADFRSAFRARGANIAGALSLADKESKGFRCQGKVDLKWITVGGHMELSGSATVVDGLLNLFGARLCELKIDAETVGEAGFSPDQFVRLRKVNLEGCRVSGSCSLRDVHCQRFYGKGLQVEGDLTIAATVSTPHALEDPPSRAKEDYDVQLESCRVSGVCYVAVDCTSFYARGLIVQGQLDVSEMPLKSGASVDLRDVRCGSLRDNGARVWHAATVKLENFKYGSMDLGDESINTNEVEDRLKWISGRSKPSRILLLLPRQEHSFSFSAQPYTQLAQAFRQRGEDEAARKVEARRILHEKCYQATNRWVKFCWRVYGVGFGFGLSTLRAFVTLLLFWIVADVGIHVLNHEDLLAANVNTTVSAGLAGGKVVQLFGSTQKPPPHPGCGDIIVPELYAVQLLIPILNLHQVGQCEIREDAKIWEYIRAGYLFFATIATSLAFLTFSGIARRWELSGAPNQAE